MKGRLTRDEFEAAKKGLRPGTKVKILTGSMSPFIKAGDSVILKPFEKDSLNRFDPVVFWEEDTEILICHFFYGTNTQDGETTFITKALNAKNTDTPFREQDILGVVIQPRLPWWKRALMTLIF